MCCGTATKFSLCVFLECFLSGKQPDVGVWLVDFEDACFPSRSGSTSCLNKGQGPAARSGSIWCFVEIL